MSSEITTNDFVFMLNPINLPMVEDTNSCYLSHNFYPNEAKGWVDDVYYPREETSTSNAKLDITEDKEALCLPSLVWKETETTGFGIYSYEDTTALHIPLDNDNYDVTITFYNPHELPYKACIKVDNILKVDEVNVDSSTKDITFFTCIVHNVLNLKVLPNYQATTKEDAIEAMVYIKQIIVKKRPINIAGIKPTIYLASDSTVQTYDKSTYPQTGWGEVLIHYFNKDNHSQPADCPYPQAKVYESDDVIIENRAIGGRSARSFLEEGRLDYILRDIKPGDYVFIQFGHNDATKARPNRYVSSDDFPTYITYYIDSIKQRNATPVLVTPVARRNCDEVTGQFSISFGSYRNAMIELSKTYHIPLLDLGKASTDYCNLVGPEESKKLFLWVTPGEYPDSKYVDGVYDNTHLQREGANTFASCVVQLIKEYNQDEQLDVLKRMLS